MVQQKRDQAAEWEENETGRDATMHRRTGEQGERVFPGETQHAEEQVDDLQDGDRAHSSVEIGGEEVPEDFWPEEALKAGSDLACCGY